MSADGSPAPRGHRPDTLQPDVAPGVGAEYLDGDDGATGPGASPDAPAPTDSLTHLRVVVFSDAIPGRNGVGTFYDDLSDALGPHLGAIRVIAPEATPAADEGGWSLPLPGDPTQRVHIPSVRRLWKQVRWTKPHVILAATPSVYGVTGLLMAARLRAGAALCYHTEFPALARAYWTGVRAAVLPRLLAGWDRLLVRFSPAVLAPNEDLAGVLARKGRADAHVMGTLAPRSFVETPPAPAPTAIRRVLFVGRLAAEKRVEQVVEAARRHPALSFHVVGDGPLRGDIEQAADELPNLDHTPWVGRSEVMRRLDETDLLVLPSRHETFGTVAFEAMVRRRATLVSPACGITGWPSLTDALFVMGPDERVCDSLDRLRALDADTIRTTAERARGAALALHTRSVHLWLDLLAGLAKRKSPSADRSR